MPVYIEINIHTHHTNSSSWGIEPTTSEAEGRTVTIFLNQTLICTICVWYQKLHYTVLRIYIMYLTKYVISRGPRPGFIHVTPPLSSLRP